MLRIFLFTLILLSYTNAFIRNYDGIAKSPSQRRLNLSDESSSNNNINNNINLDRRDVLQQAGQKSFIASVVPFLQGGKPVHVANAAASSVQSSPTITKPLASLPMMRVRLPKGVVGREFVLIKLKIQGKGPYDFMVDSGLTTELITPHLKSILGLDKDSNIGEISAVAAGGGNKSELVVLKDLSLCCGDFLDPSVKELKLPPLIAAVTDFPMEHMDPNHDPVEGMIGMELLEYFDSDFDFPSQRLKLWKHGSVDTAGLVEIPAAVINETGLIAIRVVNDDQRKMGVKQQPVAGILDSGASFTVINWAAAEQMGLPLNNYDLNTNTIAGVGLDGEPLLMPMVPLRLSFVGMPTKKDSEHGDDNVSSFDPPPSNWTPWNVRVAIGDIPAFTNLLGDGITPYKGPAVLVGLDVLSQRRFVLGTGDRKERARRVYISPRS